MTGHSTDVPFGSAAVEASPREGVRPLASDVALVPEPPRFEDVYAEHFPFVWRSVRRLGVDASAVDDVVQEIFLVVHRRLAEFEARASMKTWLFGIALFTVKQHRRTLRRKPAQLGGSAAMDPDVEQVRDASDRGPHEHATQREAVRTLHALLDELDDDKRAVLVLSELEQMTVPEIAEAVEANVNTVYSRLRAARRELDAAVARHRARDAHGAHTERTKVEEP
jgi:RNA polymerase sigma-70 factor (ECF subfamily)